MTRPADVVIIGAGVTGASIAYQLGRRGVRRVLVVERRFVGAGATGKSSALIRMHYTNAPEARLAIASFPWFTQWADLVGGSCGYVRTGFVRLVTPDKIANLRANVAMLQRLGAKTRLITAAELGELDPAVVADDIEVAAYEPESGYADPVGTASTCTFAPRPVISPWSAVARTWIVSTPTTIPRARATPSGLRSPRSCRSDSTVWTRPSCVAGWRGSTR